MPCCAVSCSCDARVADRSLGKKAGDAGVAATGERCCRVGGERVSLVLALVILLVGCQSGARFTVTNDPVTPTPFVGFGAEFNPYLYCRPNWGDVNEANVADLERKIVDLAPQHVRIFMLLQWWTPQGDFEIAKGDPRMVESFIRTVRLAQRAGASVNVTLWYGPWKDPEAQMKRFVEILGKLIRDEKLIAIQYVTIQNEPNGEDEKGPYKISFATYNRLYRALDSELRAAGLREQIKIVGGDLLARVQEMWFRNLGENLAEICDGYSIHSYWEYWNLQRPIERLKNTAALVASFPPVQRRPLYVMEFGVRGIRSANEEPGRFGDGRLITDTIAQAQQIARFNLQAINCGFVVTVQWDAYDADYDIPMRYGVIGDVKTGWKLRPSYHLLRMLTHSIKPGWSALRVEGASEGQSIAAMRGTNGELTIFAQNREDESETLTVGGLEPVRLFHVTFWNAHGDGNLTSAPDASTDARGTLRIKIPPMSVTALTTLNPEP